MKEIDIWLDQFRKITKEMDFREGGRWLYAMISLENVARYSLVEFVKIEPKSSFTTRNSFSDENGNASNKSPTNEPLSNQNDLRAGASLSNLF